MMAMGQPDATRVTDRRRQSMTRQRPLDASASKPSWSEHAIVVFVDFGQFGRRVDYCEVRLKMC